MHTDVQSRAVQICTYDSAIVLRALRSSMCQDFPEECDSARREEARTLKKTIQAKAKSGIVAVGAGRGFVVQAGVERLVITAGHCLPSFPICASISTTDERTYRELIGPLGKKPKVWAECLFADPISDIAVLGSPDGQVFWDDVAAYEELVDAAEPISITDLPKRRRAPTSVKSLADFPCARGWMFSLDGSWIECTVGHNRSMCWIEAGADKIQGGMSGSPILADDGRAMGVVVTTEGPHPRLFDNLPGWLLRRLLARSAFSRT